MSHAEGDATKFGGKVIETWRRRGALAHTVMATERVPEADT
jgi:hypothetical protein